MNRLVKIAAIALVLAGGVALSSCEKSSWCQKLEDKCQECFTGSSLSTCLQTVDVCEIYPAGTLRDDCCENQYNAVKNCTL